MSPLKIGPSEHPAHVGHLGDVLGGDVAVEDGGIIKAHYMRHQTIRQGRAGLERYWQPHDSPVTGDRTADTGSPDNLTLEASLGQTRQQACSSSVNFSI